MVYVIVMKDYTNPVFLEIISVHWSKEGAIKKKKLIENEYYSVDSYHYEIECYKVSE